MNKIELHKLTYKKPDFLSSNSTKEETLLSWLISWVDYSIKKEEFNYGDFLPTKEIFSSYLGTSLGTLQNALRKAQDMGYFESKQSVGTFVKNPKDKDFKFIKMFSKKQSAKEQIIKHMLANNFQLGENLSSVKRIASIITTSENTVRLALDELTREGYLKVVVHSKNKHIWVYQKPFKIKQKDIQKTEFVSSKNLAHKMVLDLKKYIADNFEIGQNIPSNKDLACLFNVSVRTINQATKILNKEKIILSRLGRYGTIFLNHPDFNVKDKNVDKKVFSENKKLAYRNEDFSYAWENVVELLKKHIINQDENVEKLPPVTELSRLYNVSTNTIRRAINVLSQEGYVFVQRGKYGGVFILERPEVEQSETYKWLAINPKVIK